MSSHELSKEEQILRAVKRVLTEVIKDTATGPGMKHPLSENTINGLRDCLVLISQRQHELAEEAGRPNTMRPYFTDEPQKQDEVVVPISSLSRKKKED